MSWSLHRTRRWLPALVLLAIVAGLVAPANATVDQGEGSHLSHPDQAGAQRPVGPAQPPQPLQPLQPLGRADRRSRAKGEWSVKCNVNRTAHDDPIVFPNQPGRAHLHNFFGNQTASTSPDTNALVAGTSDCLKGMGTSDKALYWAPALLRGGQPLDAGAADHLRIDAYYRSFSDTPVQPMPLGLRMIAGDATATSPQSIDVAHYNCLHYPQGGQVTSSSAALPDCPPGSYLSARVNFPSCWNGVDLDRPDHTSHVAYPAPDGTCPPGHPVPLPVLAMRIRWKAAQAVPAAELSLASGGQLSLHADFWNGWNPDVMRWLIDNCLNVKRNCNDIFRDQIAVADSQFPLVADPPTAQPEPGTHAGMPPGTHPGMDMATDMGTDAGEVAPPAPAPVAGAPSPAPLPGSP